MQIKYIFLQLLFLLLCCCCWRIRALYYFSGTTTENFIQSAHMLLVLYLFCFKCSQKEDMLLHNLANNSLHINFLNILHMITFIFILNGKKNKAITFGISTKGLVALHALHGQALIFWNDITVQGKLTKYNSSATVQNSRKPKPDLSCKVFEMLHQYFVTNA